MIQIQSIPTTRIALPVLEDQGMQSIVNQHFGKSKGFIIVNSDGTELTYIDTASARKENECAPIRALVEHGCKTLLCHSMGRGALARSHQAGLLIYQAQGGQSIAEALDAFRQGKCPDLPDRALCNHHHHDGEAHACS